MLQAGTSSWTAVVSLAVALAMVAHALANHEYHNPRNRQVRVIVFTVLCCGSPSVKAWAIRFEPCQCAAVSKCCDQSIYIYIYCLNPLILVIWSSFLLVF